MVKKRKISVQAGKAKGRRLQQWVCEKLSKMLCLPWGPDEMIASREMGQAGCDVRLIGVAKKLFPFAVECKNQEKWAIHQWIKQAKENSSEDMKWLLIAKRNHMDPVVILDAEDFFYIWDKVLKSEGI